MKKLLTMPEDVKAYVEAKKAYEAAVNRAEELEKQAEEAREKADQLERESIRGKVEWAEAKKAEEQARDLARQAYLSRELIAEAREAFEKVKDETYQRIHEEAKAKSEEIFQRYEKALEALEAAEADWEELRKQAAHALKECKPAAIGFINNPINPPAKLTGPIRAVVEARKPKVPAWLK